jgi:hypothetical protein
MNQKNKDLPAYPIKFNDQFGQLVILGGMTKLELVAMEILKSNYTNKEFEFIGLEGDNFYIKCAYETAELFCNYQEEKTEHESKIIS